MRNKLMLVIFWHIDSHKVSKRWMVLRFCCENYTFSKSFPQSTLVCIVVFWAQIVFKPVNLVDYIHSSLCGPPALSVFPLQPTLNCPSCRRNWGKQSWWWRTLSPVPKTAPAGACVSVLRHVIIRRRPPYVPTGALWFICSFHINETLYRLGINIHPEGLNTPKSIRRSITQTTLAGFLIALFSCVLGHPHEGPPPQLTSLTRYTLNVSSHVSVSKHWFVCRHHINTAQPITIGTFLKLVKSILIAVPSFIQSL